VLFDNKRVTNSAYFVKDLDPSNDRLVFSGLAVVQPSPDLIDINYSKEDAGWIVLPMHLDPGWKAYVNGRPVRYDTYIGILPAIPVNGPGHIVFRYRSESFRRGLIVGVAGLFVFLAFSVWCLRSSRRHKDS
jgi:uncharacterized membrane protein YfhO